MLTTLGSLRTDVRARVNDSDSSDYIWSDVELNAYIKEGYNLFCSTTKCIWRREAIPDIADEPLYDLPVGVVELDRVTWDNRRIGPAPPDYFMHKDPAFEYQSGDVFTFMLDGDGYRKIRKIRAPGADDPDKFYVEYYSLGETLSSDSTEFEIPRWYARYVRHFACFRAFNRRGEGQNEELAKHYQSRWLEGLERAQDRSHSAFARRAGILGGSGQAPKRGIPRGPRFPANFGRTVGRRGW